MVISILESGERISVKEEAFTSIMSEACTMESGKEMKSGPMAVFVTQMAMCISVAGKKVKKMERDDMSMKMVMFTKEPSERS